MHVKFSNIDLAFKFFVNYFATTTNKQVLVDKTSRNGIVRQIDQPVIITYLSPLRRVLTNEYRDANPFFHVVESLWMLAGRNDLAALQRYVSTFDQFSDDGETLNGAYGYRWRHAHLRPPAQEVGDEIGGVDQLAVLIDHLSKYPDSRRAVLQMWNVADDLLKITGQETFNAVDGFQKWEPPSKDVCCNLSAVFSLTKLDEENGKTAWVLDMTVFNRSNDLIWGALGANAVHFSFLQEYVAACLSVRMNHSVEVGVYNQVTNNLHVYLDRFDPSFWLHDDRQRSLDCSAYAQEPLDYCPGGHVPLVSDPERFDCELALLFREPKEIRQTDFSEPFLAKVAVPMILAFDFHKQRSYGTSILVADTIQDVYWRQASLRWLHKRWQSYEAKLNGKEGEA